MAATNRWCTSHQKALATRFDLVSHEIQPHSPSFQYLTGVRRSMPDPRQCPQQVQSQQPRQAQLSSCLPDVHSSGMSSSLRHAVSHGVSRGVSHGVSHGVSRCVRLCHMVCHAVSRCIKLSHPASHCLSLTHTGSPDSGSGSASSSVQIASKCRSTCTNCLICKRCGQVALAPFNK